MKTLHFHFHPAPIHSTVRTFAATISDAQNTHIRSMWFLSIYFISGRFLYRSHFACIQRTGSLSAECPFRVVLLCFSCLASRHAATGKRPTPDISGLFALLNWRICMKLQFLGSYLELACLSGAKCPLRQHCKWCVRRRGELSSRCQDGLPIAYLCLHFVDALSGVVCLSGWSENNNLHYHETQ